MKTVLRLLVLFYRYVISPLLPNRCIYYPTCSTYALEALETHGALKGSILSVKRILRCNPFAKGGYDPVPEKGCWHNGLHTCNSSDHQPSGADSDRLKEVCTASSQAVNEPATSAVAAKSTTDCNNTDKSSNGKN